MDGVTMCKPAWADNLSPTDPPGGMRYLIRNDTRARGTILVVILTRKHVSNVHRVMSTVHTSLRLSQIMLVL